MASSVPPSNGACPLLDITPELRLNIYDLVFPNGSCFIGLKIMPSGMYTVKGPCSSDRIPMNLLYTCRTINNEATPICYLNTHFLIKMDMFILPEEESLARHVSHMATFGAYANMASLTLVLRLGCMRNSAMDLALLKKFIRGINTASKMKDLDITTVLEVGVSRRDFDEVMAILGLTTLKGRISTGLFDHLEPTANLREDIDVTSYANLAKKLKPYCITAEEVMEIYG